MLEGWRTAGSGFGAAARSLSQLRRRAKELGAEVPAHAEKSELVDLVEQAESRELSASGPMRSVAELKNRLRELGLEVPSTICEKKELIDLVNEAERQHAKSVRSPARPGSLPTSPQQPKVRYRNAAGNIPPPWYQMESRSRPGNFYYVNADTGERTWEMPKGGQPPPPPRQYQAYRHVPADFVPAAPAGQPAASSSALPFSPSFAGASPSGMRGPGGTMVPPGMPPLPGHSSHASLGSHSPVPRGMPPLPGDGAAISATAALAAATAAAQQPCPISPSSDADAARAWRGPSPTSAPAAAVEAPEEAPDAVDVFGQTNPMAEALQQAAGELEQEAQLAALGTVLLPALETTAHSDPTQDESARHDYRDQGFRERGPPLAPAHEKRWSRNGSMSCQRHDLTGCVQALSLTVAQDEWDPETTISPDQGGAIKGSHFTWIRGQMLGRGSLGRVFKALDCKTGKTMAVKEVPIDLNSESDRKYIEDLQNEVSIMQELKHPNIVRYLGHDFMDNSLYMYIEHMPGGSLTQALQQFGAFDEGLLAQYAKQILSGLEYMHTRDPPVVHRDIKGPNILVGADCRVKLADFGCAKRTQETMTHTMRGSIHWMAPEVIAHERYGRAADIWSFGCVAIEMGTATVPWGKLDNQMAAVIKIGMSEETPPLPEGLSPVGEDFIAVCVQRDANRRPTATALLGHALVCDVPLPPAEGED